MTINVEELNHTIKYVHSVYSFYKSAVDFYEHFSNVTNASEETIQEYKDSLKYWNGRWDEMTSIAVILFRMTLEEIDNIIKEDD